MTKTSGFDRRAFFLVAGGLVAGTSALIATTGATRAQGAVAMKLFKIVTPRDDLTIGVPQTDLDAMGQGPDVDRLARTIATRGELSAWQYAVGRNSAGELAQMPRQRVSVFAAGIVRIEPMTTPYAVVAP